jgi:hypothetical protein
MPAITKVFFGFKIATFTLEQKVNITTGVGWDPGKSVYSFDNCRLHNLFLV